jgi:hypothetical protein
LPRLEAHRGARGDVEPEAVGLRALEGERVVGLEEVVVRADLDRAVAGIGDLERHGRAALVDLYVAFGDLHFAWNHGLKPHHEGHEEHEEINELGGAMVPIMKAVLPFRALRVLRGESLWSFDQFT